MSRLLSFFPAAWRERYGAEMADLLAARPPAVGDRLDLLRAALDAWVHPQVRRLATVDHDDGRTARGATAIGVVGGALFVASGLRIAASSGLEADGYRDNGYAIPILILGMLLTGLAALLKAAEPGQRRIAGVVIAGSLLTAMPWPILGFGFLMYACATIALGGILVAGGRLSGIVLVAAGLILPVFNTQNEQALAAVPVGLLWILFAITYRGATRLGARSEAIPAIRDAGG